MGSKDREAGIAPALVVIALGMAGCGAADGGPGVEKLGNPYSFERIQALAGPAIAPGSDRASAVGTRRGEIAALYGDMLKTLDATYRDGLGPAKGSPAYAACKAAFREVAQLLEAAPAQAAEAQGLALKDRLVKCRSVARTWSLQGEIGTFGNDVKQVASGSLYLTGIAMVGAGADEAGDKVAGEAAAMMRADRPAQ